MVCLPTQWYDAPSSRFGRTFVTILAMELDGIQYRKWNSGQVIVFQSVILQRVQPITGTKNIRAWIKFQLDCCNYVEFDELVNDTYTAATGYLGRDRGIQSEEKRHCTFSNLFLHGKLRKAVIFVCEHKRGEFLQPGNLASDKTDVINETVASILAGKYLHEKKYHLF